ncbi:hypothetical protein [Aliiglaciecola lipolytica]|uniref:Uncharacterized protein n=1 Tax=Aliiglaciecola lipolytica E3 TaxID=1127673 RepID=K6XWL8_9ALTE|nr:hypothetical protein [Aliiglaciecola lipolytica]GAC16056.1 hypothetical protein GLIP_3442 [Aliiglaciecola lipolytica E3]
MNRKLKAGISIGAITFTLFVVVQPQFSNVDSFCQNIDIDKYTADSNPANPVNRCANANQKNVSWMSWFSGRSRYQFHYLDLLELLSRTTDKQPTSHSSAG